MPDIQSFAAIRYNYARVDITDTVAPPYDVISADDHEFLLGTSPHNIVRVELPTESGNGDPYTTAGKLFHQWLGEGILTRDSEPAFYLYDQTFTNMRGARVKRDGFFCCCRLEEFARGNVLPHERTLSAPKEDRLQLMHAVQADISPIFCLYDDAERSVDRAVERAAGHAEATIDDRAGVRHVLRRSTGGRVMEEVRRLMLDRPIYIADGHHRYETALRFRDEMRLAHPEAGPDAPWNFVLMYLACLGDDGVEIQPTHRIVHGLPDFDRESFERELSKLFTLSRRHPLEHGTHALKELAGPGFLLAYPGTGDCILADLRSDVDRAAAMGDDTPAVLHAVDVSVLHRLVFRTILGMTEDSQLRKEHLEYGHTVSEVRSALERPEVQCAMLLNPTTMDQLRAAANAGIPLPQKSTYFYPKLLTGLVMHGW